MKQIASHEVAHPVHVTLQQKDERELYSSNPLDYYAHHYRLRIATVSSLVKKQRAKNIIEIGAAQGNIALRCAEGGCRSIALDINFFHLSYSRKKFEYGAMSWVAASADNLPFKSTRFDTIILGELLEHCAWPEQILKSAAQLLSENGTIIITTPNNRYRNSIEPPFSSVANNRASIEQHQFGPDGENHLFTFTPKELSTVVSSAGLCVDCMRFIGSHFLHLPQLYHLRKKVPLIFNTLLEKCIPSIPIINHRYCDTLLCVVRKGKNL